MDLTDLLFIVAIVAILVSSRKDEVVLEVTQLTSESPVYQVQEQEPAVVDETPVQQDPAETVVIEWLLWKFPGHEIRFVRP